MMLIADCHAKPKYSRPLTYYLLAKIAIHLYKSDCKKWTIVYALCCKNDTYKSSKFSRDVFSIQPEYTLAIHIRVDVFIIFRLVTRYSSKMTHHLP